MVSNDGCILLEKENKLCYDNTKCAGITAERTDNHMYKCCIFDLDGTLVNSIYAIQKSVNETLKLYNLGPISVEDTKEYVGDGYKKLMERALRACGDEKLTHYEESLGEYSRIFKDCCLYRVEAYPGIRELIDFLKAHGIKCAVLSNKPHDRAVDNVEGVFQKGYFDLVYGERESEGIRRKPQPDGVLAILKELGIKKEDCLYFGDTNTDMETGRNAGVDTVGVTWGFRPRKELEDYEPRLVADDTAQVIAYIKDVNGIEE